MLLNSTQHWSKSGKAFQKVFKKWPRNQSQNHQNFNLFSKSSELNNHQDHAKRKKKKEANCPPPPYKPLLSYSFNYSFIRLHFSSFERWIPHHSSNNI
jgi:hypothetical protein